MQQPVEAMDQEVDLLGARGRAGRDLQLFGDLRHFASSLPATFRFHLIEDHQKALSNAGVIRNLPQIFSGLLPFHAQLAEGVEERGMRAPGGLGV